MRGDPPPRKQAFLAAVASTPHARGSTRYAEQFVEWFTVYPACAGIHPELGLTQQEFAGLPRMRGDPPSSGTATIMWVVSTPHARGSTVA